MTRCTPITSKAPWLASATIFSSCTATSNGRTVYSFATRPFLTNKSYITECSPLGDGSGRGLSLLGTDMRCSTYLFQVDSNPSDDSRGVSKLYPQPAGIRPVFD